MKLSSILLPTLAVLIVLVALLLPLRTRDTGTEFPVTLTAAEVETYYENAKPEDYAHLRLDGVSPELKVVIVDARNRIANECSWVADNTYGWITDANGITIEVLPKFHEIFPTDWDLPTDPENRGIVG